MKKLSFQVEPADANQRIDKFLVDKLKDDFSRSEIKRFIEQDNVSLNGKSVKTHQKVKANDLIELFVSYQEENIQIPPVDIPLDIIFEDDFLLVINKPAGMVVHPAAGHFDDTLVNAILFYGKSLSDINGLTKPGIVHRLDKDTSGVIVIAKDNRTHRFLAKQFKNHEVEKIYLAIVSGSVEYDEGIIDEPISRSPFDRKKMKVSHVSSRQAITRYRVIKRTKKASVLEVFPQTGRTHQIRVHMAYLGHPIIGDSQYGKNQSDFQINRQSLHAKKIGFIHPKTKKQVVFQAPVPIDMQDIIAKLM